jgi:uncharacterized protein (TIGR03118 family)
MLGPNISGRRSRVGRALALASLALASLAGALLATARPLGAQLRVVQTNLVSDIPGLALTLDPQLKNPWGISFSGGSPMWVSDAGTGVSTLYNGAGAKQALVVGIPGPGGGVPGVPTGQVFNSAGAFQLSNGANATFLFASATGTISGWNGAAGTTALTQVNNFAGGAEYTGLALGGSGAGARLYAADFGNARVDVFDGSFNPILPGTFVDPAIPAGYAPYNVHNVAGQFVVAYALKKTVGVGAVTGPGLGFVSVFDANGNLVRRLASGGPLDAPWGVAVAPASWGIFGGATLVGNFGNGRINAFEPLTGTFLGMLTDVNGAPLENDGLWEITFGNGAQGTSTSTLYFAAGINDEANGLVGGLAVVPEPSTVALTATGLGLLLASAARRRRRG